jgi:hypothetical protein
MQIPAKSGRAMLGAPSRTARRTPRVLSKFLPNSCFVKIRVNSCQSFPQNPNESFQIQPNRGKSSQPLVLLFALPPLRIFAGCAGFLFDPHPQSSIIHPLWPLRQPRYAAFAFFRPVNFSPPSDFGWSAFGFLLQLAFLHQSQSQSESVRPLKIMNHNRNSKIARRPDRLGEDGRWVVEGAGSGNPNQSPRIQVNRTKSNLIVVIQERPNGPALPTNRKQNGTKAIEPRNTRTTRTKRGKSPFAFLAYFAVENLPSDFGWSDFGFYWRPFASTCSRRLSEFAVKIFSQKT